MSAILLAFIHLFGHPVCFAEDRCTNQMRCRIGLFEETGICRSSQPPEELNLRTVIDERFVAERVSENLEEIGNLQSMFCENFAVSYIKRSSQTVRLSSAYNHDICPGPKATRLRD
jgi:hypothetical protein